MTFIFQQKAQPSAEKWTSFFVTEKNAVLRKVNIMKREGQVRIPSGCAISAVISREGRRMTGEKIVESMIPMHDRSNGLGGGFAAYGIYPEYRDYYAFHIFFDSRDTRKTCEALLKEALRSSRRSTFPSGRSRRSPMCP